MNNDALFSYYWFLDERETEITSIRVYGVNKNKSICLIVDDFRPYVYLELPEKINWTSAKAKLLKNKIDESLKKYKPLHCELRLKHKLYGAHLNEEGERKLFPYLYCEFSNKGDIQKLYYAVRKGMTVAGLGSLNLKIHEQDADPILQLVSNADIPTAGWIAFKGREVSKDDKVTYCDKEYNVKWKHLKKSNKTDIAKPKIMGFDIEVNSVTGAFPDADNLGDKIFQISCIFSREGYTEDEYDIYLLTLGEPDPKKVGENVNIYMFDTEAELIEGFTELVLEENPNIISGYNIFKFDIPYMIQRAKYPCMCLNNFDKLGFHRYSHAKEKTIKWSSSAYGNQEFDFLDAEGRLFIDLLPLVQRNYKLGSYALKAVSAKFLKDTKRDLDEKGIFKCYRLGTKKEPDGSYGPKARKAMGICGAYCVKDTLLVIKLMDYFQTWFDLTEQATTYNTSIFSLYTQGQQIKVFSQVYKYNIENDIVTEKDVYQTGENERYVGAHVFEPIPGLYDRVLPFDFASLYPSTIIAYNLDYSTWVTDESIPDELCHVFKWEDHISCQHDPKVIRKNTLTSYIDEEKKKIERMMERRDNKLNKSIRHEIQEEINKKREELKPYTKERSEITSKLNKKPMCEKRYYRFLKEPKGVIPTILQNLLDARKAVRKQIKVNEKIIEKDKIKLAIVSILKGCDIEKQKQELEKLEKDIKVLESLNSVLNKRQLAYKVSANSMYGAMGVKKGYLPFMPGAMVTCYMGRVNIEKVAKLITEKFKGVLIYGDTDSNYVHFPHLETAEESWDYAVKVADEISKLFPPPIKLEFESVIYWLYLIVKKKKYMSTKCKRDGKIDKEIDVKGLVMARRDNPLLVRTLFGKVGKMIFDKIERKEVEYFIIQELNRICSNSVEKKEYVVSKSIKNTDEMNLVPFKDEKGKMKGKIGDYIVPLLPKGEKERAKQFKLKDVDNEKDYYEKCLPAVIQLAEKMRKRGFTVYQGTRLQYLIIDNGITNDKQYNKIEDFDYFTEHSDVLKIDFMYYIKQLINPVDQILNVVYKKDKDFQDFILSQYNFRLKIRQKVINQLKKLFKPTLVFEK